MMEPHASLARWDGDKVTIWTSNQMINWGKKRPRQDAGYLGKDNVRLISPYVGGGFGGKLFLRDGCGAWRHSAPVRPVAR